MSLSHSNSAPSPPPPKTHPRAQHDNPTPTPPPGFLLYAGLAAATLVYLIYWVAPKHGTTNIFVYLGICSAAGSLSVVCCKALGVAIKLTLQGSNQLTDPHTLVFTAVRRARPYCRAFVLMAAPPSGCC